MDLRSIPGGILLFLSPSLNLGCCLETVDESIILHGCTTWDQQLGGRLISLLRWYPLLD